MTKKILRKSSVYAAAFIALTLMLGGCGGGGGSTGVKTRGEGYVSARVSFQGTAAYKSYVAAREADRSAGLATTSSSIKVTITISGIYGEDGTAFPPVTAAASINPLQGYGSVSITKVPIGINHLLVATAKWPEGATETVKCIIPQVLEGETTRAAADQESTVAANAAIYYAQKNKITLPQVSASVFIEIEAVIAELLDQGIPYSQMTGQMVIEYEGPAVASITVAPPSATLTVGGTQQFTATALDSGGGAVTGASIMWTVTSSIGAIDSAGLFTATGVGSGTVTATADGVSGTASLAVSAVCSANADCDDGLTTTLDTCVAPGSAQASCTNDPLTCSADTGCDDGNALTLDSCEYPGTAYSSCAHVAISCNAAADCDDMDALTADTCLNAGTEQSSCQHTTITTIVCSAAADCDDGSVLTIDACLNAGTAQSSCTNTLIACNASTDCTAAAAPVCIGGGTTSAVCIACSTAANCADTSSLTIDACVSPGTAQAACTHTAIACNTSADCLAPNPVCIGGGTTSSACIACSTVTECNDNDATTIDACTGGGTTSAVCSHTPISVDGVVTSGGSPVAGAVVRLYNSGLTYDTAVITDAAGYYYFTGVPSGAYYIVATKDNMTLVSRTVTVP